MNDNRTEEQKYEAWVNVVNITKLYGWRHVNGWVFKSPSGTKHDLSAADLNKLDKIEENGSFLAP